MGVSVVAQFVQFALNDLYVSYVEKQQLAMVDCCFFLLNSFNILCRYKHFYVNLQWLYSEICYNKYKIL